MDAEDKGFEKVMHAMDLLRKHKLPFGISTCYTSANYADISSEQFFDMMIEMGAMFVWFFHYMPVGNEAVPQLLPTPEQRKMVYERVREFRNTKPIFSMDFQNDAEYVGAALPEAGIIYISMLPGMWSRVCLSIILM